MPYDQQEILEALLVLCQALKDELTLVKEKVFELADLLENDCESVYSRASDMAECTDEEDFMDEEKDDC